MTIGLGWSNASNIVYTNNNGNHEYFPPTPYSSIGKHRFFTDSELISLYYCIPEIFAPIHEIATRVTNASFNLMRVNQSQSTDSIIYNDQDFNRLMTKPNPFYTGKKHIYQAVAYYLVTGKLYHLFNKPDTIAGNDFRDISTWYNLPSDHIEVEVMDNPKIFTATELKDVIKGYFMSTANGRIEFAPAKVLPINCISLDWCDKLVLGKSPLISAEKPLRNLIDVYEARGVIYRKRGAMGVWTSRKGDASGMTALSPQETKQMREDMDAAYGLTGNRSTIGVTGLPVDFIQSAMSIAELLPFDETLADAIAIYKVLGVPDHFAPSKDKSAYDNANVAEKSIYENTVIPIANMLAEAWTSYFKLPDERKYITANFSHIEVLQENKKEKSLVDKTYGDIWLQRWTNGACTLNEWISAIDGTKGAGPIYDSKIFDLDEENRNIVLSIIKKMTNATGSNQASGSQDNTSGSGQNQGG